MPVSGIEQPDEITVGRGRSEMRLAWSDGRTGCISASTLRQACRCGWCTRDRVTKDCATGGAAPEAAQVLVDDVTVLGSHGLHVRFSDGHERGIFPWPYLAELAGARAQGASRPRSIHDGAAA